MFNASMPSLADIAAVTNNGRNNDDGMFGNNGWWILIILWACWGGGWGGYGANGANGYDGYSQAASNYTDAAIQRGFDHQSIITKLEGLEQSNCTHALDQLNQTNQINTNIMQTGYGLQNAIQQNAVSAMQNMNALQAQLSGMNYNMATDTCAVTTAINQLGQNIINNDNANYRALHDELVQSQLDAKDNKIAEQQALITQLNLTASQQAQNNYIVNQLRPYPVPAYYMANPWAGSNTCMTGCCGNS